MFFLVVTVVLIAFLALIWLDVYFPTSSQIIVAIMVVVLLSLMYRPEQMKRKEKEEHANEMLKFNDQQKVVEECEGCKHIREPYSKCEIYFLPWEAWSGPRGRCKDYEKEEDNDYQQESRQRREST